MIYSRIISKSGTVLLAEYFEHVSYYGNLMASIMISESLFISLS
jgi:hypothetical protein